MAGLCAAGILLKSQCSLTINESAGVGQYRYGFVSLVRNADWLTPKALTGHKMRSTLTIMYVLLLSMVSSGLSLAYYTAEKSCYVNEKNDLMDKANGADTATAYYVYSNNAESLCMTTNQQILLEKHEILVPVDQIKIGGDLNLNKHENDGAAVSAENMLYADIAFKNAYEEYRRLHQTPRDLLKGLSVPPFSRGEKQPVYAKNASGGNVQTSQDSIYRGHRYASRNSQSVFDDISKDAGTARNGNPAMIGTKYSEKQNFSNTAISAKVDDNAPNENIDSQSKSSRFDAPGNGAKAGIGTNQKASEKRDGARAIVLAVAAVQEFILSNPQLFIVALLIAGMVVSLLRSNTHKK